ncbi:MAG: type II secretion system F family protein [Chloroflexi bacterium]|nr:type II secretion system F family protein [Chloroflexota bacterium]
MPDPTSFPVALLIGGAAFLVVVYAVLLFTRDRREEIRSMLDTYTSQPDAQRRGRSALHGSFWERIVSPVLGGFARVLSSTAPQGIRARSAQKLIMAGNPIGVSTFLTLRGISLFSLPVAYLAYARIVDQPPSVFQLAILIATILLGRGLPDLILGLAISRRKKTIERSIPDAVDLIVACVEAGLSLDGALMKVTERTTGPLRDEFSQALQEIRLGRRRQQALRDVAMRSGVASLQSLSQAIAHAELMGVSIADVLRTLADDLRNKRKLRAQEMAQKAPLKMMPVIVFFIFPAMFVVLLGPAVITVRDLFGG